VPPDGALEAVASGSVAVSVLESLDPQAVSNKARTAMGMTMDMERGVVRRVDMSASWAASTTFIGP
jgi:hypothetical protein